MEAHPPMSDDALKSLIQQLKLPPKNLAKLSFCPTKASKVREWVESLPATRISSSSVMLYQSLPELARLDNNPLHRLEMLEAMRPYVQLCISGLGKEFLEQALNLSDSAVKSATIAQALQKHMSHGYLSVARDLIEADKEFEAQAQALHRAATGLGLMLMRNLQLYTPAPQGLWQSLYAILKIAEEQEILDDKVKDSLLENTQSTSTKDAILRPILLGLCQPNQLRQQEIARTYSELEHWSHQVSIEQIDPEAANDDEEHFYLICSDIDTPAMSKDQYKGAFDNTTYRLDTSKLIAQLEKELEHMHEQGQTRKLAGQLTETLIDHLLIGWDSPHARRQPRVANRRQLEVCLGISAVHHHVSQGQSLEEIMGRKNSDTSFASHALSQEVDPWDDAPDTGTHTMIEHRMFSTDFSSDFSNNFASQSAQAKASPYPVYQVSTLDASPKGYCLNWRDGAPNQVRTGEVIGLRAPNRDSWQIGVIRWLRQFHGATQVGIQLLGGNAQALGAAYVHKTGDMSQFMKVLKLPAQILTSQQDCLLTPALPFTEQGKCRLRRSGQEQSIKLQKSLFSSSAARLFGIQVLENISKDSTATSNEKTDKPNSDFNDSW